MKTKKAVKLVADKYEGWMGYARSQKEVDKLGKERDGIIELLQSGKKYEKIFNTILNWTTHDGDFIPAKELINLEQKYFPKV